MPLPPPHHHQNKIGCRVLKYEGGIMNIRCNIQRGCVVRSCLRCFDKLASHFVVYIAPCCFRILKTVEYLQHKIIRVLASSIPWDRLWYKETSTWVDNLIWQVSPFVSILCFQKLYNSRLSSRIRSRLTFIKTSKMTCFITKKFEIAFLEDVVGGGGDQKTKALKG